MPTNETIKTFKNSKVNVQIRQENFISESSKHVDEHLNLSNISAQDFANLAYTSFQTDENFNARAVLKDLKDTLLSKINGESSFLKESEIDALELKTPASLKNHMPEKKERKARKTAYKEQYALIKQLEKKETLTASEVKEVEKRLLALEGYENDTELNALTDLKYDYLAEKNGEIEFTNATDKLSQYYIEHSKLKDIYQNFDYKKYEGEIELKRNLYAHYIGLINDISYDLPNAESESDSYSQKLVSYDKAFKEIKESNAIVDKRLHIILLYNDVDNALNKLCKNFNSIKSVKIDRRDTIENYGINLAKKENYYDKNYNFSNHLESILHSMVSDCKIYIKNMLDEMKEFLTPSSDVLQKLKDYSDIIANTKFSSFDYLFDTIAAFDKSISPQIQNRFGLYTSLSNYISGKKELNKTLIIENHEELKEQHEQKEQTEQKIQTEQIESTVPNSLSTKDLANQADQQLYEKLYKEYATMVNIYNNTSFGDKKFKKINIKLKNNTIKGRINELERLTASFKDTYGSIYKARCSFMDILNLLPFSFLPSTNDRIETLRNVLKEFNSELLSKLYAPAPLDFMKVREYINNHNLNNINDLNGLFKYIQDIDRLEETTFTSKQEERPTGSYMNSIISILERKYPTDKSIHSWKNAMEIVVVPPIDSIKKEVRKKDNTKLNIEVNKEIKQDNTLSQSKNNMSSEELEKTYSELYQSCTDLINEYNKTNWGEKGFKELTLTLKNKTTAGKISELKIFMANFNYKYMNRVIFKRTIDSLQKRGGLMASKQYIVKDIVSGINDFYTAVKKSGAFRLRDYVLKYLDKTKPNNLHTYNDCYNYIVKFDSQGFDINSLPLDGKKSYENMMHYLNSHLKRKS